MVFVHTLELLCVIKEKLEEVRSGYSITYVWVMSHNPVVHDLSSQRSDQLVIPTPVLEFGSNSLFAVGIFDFLGGRCFMPEELLWQNYSPNAPDEYVTKRVPRGDGAVTDGAAAYTLI